MDVKLTAQDIARELMIDARRVDVEEDFDSHRLRVRVKRDSDQRWRGWSQPVGTTDLSSELLDDMRIWVKS